jgi:hypothetical protein
MNISVTKENMEGMLCVSWIGSGLDVFKSSFILTLATVMNHIAHLKCITGSVLAEAAKSLSCIREYQAWTCDDT